MEEGQMTGKGLFILLTFFSMTQGAYSSNKTICGETDDRIPSQNPKIARVQQRTAPAGCTMTMIGRTCAISAGHCVSTFEVAEFNTPASRGGRVQHPDPEDIYEVDKETLVYRNQGRGQDYAVVRLKANEITGKLPGDAQGFYEVSFDMPSEGDTIRITGYGADRSQGDRNYAQQTNTGPIYSIEGSILNHRADTMGGNSGSSVILESTQQIIGIHTHGGCYSRGGSNSSTLIATQEEFKSAISECLRFEDENL